MHTKMQSWTQTFAGVILFSMLAGVLYADTPNLPCMVPTSVKGSEIKYSCGKKLHIEGTLVQHHACYGILDARPMAIALSLLTFATLISFRRRIFHLK
ncbi:MAG: hypothetical protein C0507_23210 [Cyanobacteria bacterium PR.3.49]|nr:hypothetical protein [Cyanobacteria bacterium PR.3.49]